MDMTSTATVDRQSPAFDAFITGLRDAHGLEQQALQIMQRQKVRLHWGSHFQWSSRGDKTLPNHMYVWCVRSHSVTGQI